MRLKADMESMRREAMREATAARHGGNDCLSAYWKGVAMALAYATENKEAPNRLYTNGFVNILNSDG